MKKSIMFHYFHGRGYKKVQGAFSSQELEKLILSKNFNILSPYDFLEKKKNRKLEENHVFLSFDDGLKEQYDVALPVLNKYGIKALFNIYTSNTFYRGVCTIELYRYFRNHFFKDINHFYIDFFELVKFQYGEFQEYKNVWDRYLSEFSFYSPMDRKFRYFRDVLIKKEFHFVMKKMMESHNFNERLFNKIWMSDLNIKNLNNSGHMIGLHSHSHAVDMDKWTYNQSISDYKKNKLILEKILKNKIMIAAYPLGRYNDSTVKALKQLGIVNALTSKPENNNDEFHIDRIDIAEIIGRY